MRKKWLSLIALALLVPVISFAAEVKTGEVLPATEKPNNLYFAGENPTVDADIMGDLVIAGSVVTINGTVENSVLAAGGTLNMNGGVGGSLRVAGGTVVVESMIEGDLVVFGGDVILGTKSIVRGDVIVFAGTVSLRGKVLGSVKNSYVGDVIISGNIAEDVSLGEVGSLKLDSSAVIGGDLKYSSKVEAVVATDAKVGGKVEYTKVASVNMPKQTLGERVGAALFGALMAFITLLVFLKLMPKFAAKAVNGALENPMSKIGVGFLAMVVTPIILLVLLITFFGWGVMGYLGLVYMAFFALTGTLTALLAGAYLWKLLTKTTELELSWKTAAVGVVLVAVAKMIPVVGWLAASAVALMVFGTLTTMGYEYLKSQKV